MPHGAEWSYTVELSAGDVDAPFFRAVKSDGEGDLTDDDFASNFALGKRRRWPAGVTGEDAADYYALSCYATLELANDNAIAYDSRRRRGQPPRWNGVAEFTIDSHAGHMYADSFEEGHWSIWGEAAALRSRVSRVYPIQVEES